MRRCVLVGWLARQLTHQAANGKWNAANYKNVRAARCPSSYTACPTARRPLLVQIEYHPPGLDTTRPNAMYVLKRDEYVPCCCRRQLAVESMVRSVGRGTQRLNLPASAGTMNCTGLSTASLMSVVETVADAQTQRKEKSSPPRSAGETLNLKPETLNLKRSMSGCCFVLWQPRSARQADSRRKPNAL